MDEPSPSALAEILTPRSAKRVRDALVERAHLQL
jgi:hypothetical protein